MLQTAETLSFQLFRVPLITQHFLVVAQHQALPAQLITASVARASSGTLSSRLPTQALSMWGTRRTLLIPSCNCYIQHSEEHRLAERRERERERSCTVFPKRRLRNLALMTKPLWVEAFPGGQAVASASKRMPGLRSRRLEASAGEVSEPRVNAMKLSMGGHAFRPGPSIQS